MPIPTPLVNILLTGIDAMSVVGGYNFDYGPPNVQRPAARTYPQVFLTYRDEADAGPGMAGKVSQDVTLVFRTLIAKGPGKAADEAAKVVSDQKRLMEALHPTLKAAGGYLFADPVTATWKPRLSRAIPAESTLTYRLRYRHDRTNPESP